MRRIFQFLVGAWGRALKEPAGDGAPARRLWADTPARSPLPVPGGRTAAGLARRSPSFDQIRSLRQTVFFVTAIPGHRHWPINSAPDGGNKCSRSCHRQSGRQI
jgi:hypothetical protein